MGNFTWKYSSSVGNSIQASAKSLESQNVGWTGPIRQARPPLLTTLAENQGCRNQCSLLDSSSFLKRVESWSRIFEATVRTCFSYSWDCIALRSWLVPKSQSSTAERLEEHMQGLPVFLKASCRTNLACNERCCLLAQISFVPISLLYSPLRFWPILYAACWDVAIKGICLEGQVFCITLHKMWCCNIPKRVRRLSSAEYEIASSVSNLIFLILSLHRVKGRN